MVEEMGMTNEQYKGMLLDDLEDWQEVLELAEKNNDEEVIQKAKKQIKRSTKNSNSNVLSDK